MKQGCELKSVASVVDGMNGWDDWVGSGDWVVVKVFNSDAVFGTIDLFV